MNKFSKHSLDCMEERIISRESIVAILNKETDVIVYPSTRDEDLDLYFGKDGVKYLLVVYNRETCTIVTARNMRKNEKEIYNEVIHHEKEKAN